MKEAADWASSYQGLIVWVDAARHSEPGVEALALPSRDTFFLTLIGLLDAGFLIRRIRWSLDSRDCHKAS